MSEQMPKCGGRSPSAPSLRIELTGSRAFGGPCNMRSSAAGRETQPLLDDQSGQTFLYLDWLRLATCRVITLPISALSWQATSNMHVCRNPRELVLDALQLITLWRLFHLLVESTLSHKDTKVLNKRRILGVIQLSIDRNEKAW